MAVYFDASALVKLLVDETGSEIAEALWDGSDAAISSRLAYAEVCAALAAAGRNRDLGEEGLAASEQAWETFWAAIRPVELTERVQRAAGSLAKLHRLSGADAVHLASALAFGDVVMAAWDKRLRSAAAAEFLAVAPSTLGD